MRSRNPSDAGRRAHAKADEEAGPRVVAEPAPAQLDWLEVDYGGATFLIGSCGACEPLSRQPALAVRE